MHLGKRDSKIKRYNKVSLLPTLSGAGLQSVCDPFTRLGSLLPVLFYIYMVELRHRSLHTPACRGRGRTEVESTKFHFKTYGGEGCKNPFCSYTIGHSLVMWPHWAAREVEKCSLQLRSHVPS